MVHIFVVNEENYQICIKKGLVAIPEPKETKSKANVQDGLISRIICIKENDYILMYVIGKKELRGVWKADGNAFYDTAEVWNDRLYPYRCRIKVSEFCFSNSLKLNDINDWRNQGKIWTWALQRSSGQNAMFSISNSEFDILIQEFIKINPFSQNQWRILEPYPYQSSNLLERIHSSKDKLQYEYSVMAYLSDCFNNKKYTEIFGNYTDYLFYVPTNLGKEMDILLFFNHPANKFETLSYDIIEVKRDVFDKKALAQLIDYESWFIQKKVMGDINMVRVSAIAKSFDADVIDYVEKRSEIEGRKVKLIQYQFEQQEFKLMDINKK